MDFPSPWPIDDAKNPKIRGHYGSLKMIGIESFGINPDYKSNLLEKYVDQLYDITSKKNFTFKILCFQKRYEEILKSL